MSVVDHKPGRYPCITCGKRFQRPSMLKRHETVHTGAKPFKCAECEMCFTQKASMNRHSANWHNGTERFRCPKCPCSFAQRSNMLIHLKKRHPLELSAFKGNTKRFTCNYCSCVYTTQNTLSRHVRSVHQSRKVLQTFELEDNAHELAQQVLEQLKSLQSGMEKVTNDLNKSNKKLLFEKMTEKQLINNVVMEEQALSTRTVQLKDRLNAQRETHFIQVQRIQRSNGKIYYVCEYCAKEFCKSYDFIRHRRTHTAEKPYQCTYCQRSCKTRTLMRAHLRIHRLDENFGILSKQHSCVICQQTYSSMRQLDTHICSHQQTYSLRYFCEECHSSFASKTAFSAHNHHQPDSTLEALQKLLPAPVPLQSSFVQTNSKLVSFEQRPFACNICAWKLKTKESLNHHLNRHRIQHNLQCSKCYRHFNDTIAYRLHQRLHRTVSQNYLRYICIQCPQSKKFATFQQLQRHQRDCKTMRKFKCAYCESSFKNTSHCRSHMKIHLKHLLDLNVTERTTDVNAQLKSKIRRGFVAATNVNSNEADIKIQQEYWIPNVTVSRSNQGNSTRKTAMSPFLPPTITRANLTKHQCQHCDKRFQKPSDLQRHLSTHSDEKQHECMECHKRFRLPYTLQQHQQTHKSNRQKFACQVCGKLYASPKALKVHLRLHIGELPFQCALCTRRFRTSGHHIAHMRAANCRPNESNLATTP